jgi:4-hydroxybenzoate polyprenyltransferase
VSLRRIVRAALHVNVLLALSASSVVVSTVLLADGEVPLTGVVAAFTATFAVYNFDRIADTTARDGSTSPQRDALLRRIRTPLIVAVAVAALVTLALAFASTWTGAMWTLALPLGGVLYVLPVFAGHRLKDIPYLKSVYVPACWSTFVGQAVSLGGLATDATICVFALFVFLRMVASCGIGDIRDLELDRAAGVRTFAVALGHSGARWVIEATHALSLVGIILAATFGLVPPGAACLVVPGVYGYACFRRFLLRPHGSELVLELYDFEIVAYTPLLWLVL